LQITAYSRTHTNAFTRHYERAGRDKFSAAERADLRPPLLVNLQ